MSVAIVTGATGVVGRALLGRLEASPAFERVIVAARRGPEQPRAQKVDWRGLDFERLEAELEGIEASHAFSALGTTRKKAGSDEAFRRVDLDYVAATARAAKAAGARAFVLCSSVGADPRSSNLYLRTKGEAEDAVRGVGFETVHVLRPSLLRAEREETRVGEALAQRLAPAFDWALVGGARRYRSIEASTVAAAMLEAALDGRTGAFVHEHDAIMELAEGAKSS